MRLAAHSGSGILLFIIAFPGQLFPQAAVIEQPGLPTFGQAPLPATGPSGGVADLAMQGYYIGGNSLPITSLSGVSTSFKDFFPRLGLFSGNIEAYDQNTRGRLGENYVQLKGLLWKGRRWTLTGGDFRIPGNAVTFPFQNYFIPQAGLRGGQIESQQGHRVYTLFAGQETLAAGPRISFRLHVPQNAAGASIRQTIGHLELGARYLHLSSPESAPENFIGFFPTGREFRQTDSLNLGAYYVKSPRLKFYSDVTLTHVDFLAAFPGSPQHPLSFLEGMIYDTHRMTVRANYGSQSTSYLPILGYYAGDRRGPYVDLRYRLANFLDVYASGSITRNNIERNPLVANLKAEGASGGASLVLPKQFNLSGQYSLLSLTSAQPDPSVALQHFRNSEFSVTLAKSISHQSLRLTVRELKLNSNTFHQKQPVAEVADTLSFSHFTAGASVRYQQVNTGQLQNSLFVRGSLQAHFGRFTAYGQAEVGNDLVNKSVFATNTVNTTVAGMTFSDFRGWTFSAEMFRNTLTSQLNPVSLFALQTQGIGVSTLLSDLNQWSAYIRITRRFKWGAALPEASERFMLEQLPLVGTLEGFVRLPGDAGIEGIPEVPVLLDGGRTVTTDSNGHYRFDEVPEGPHRVEVSKLELPAEYESYGRSASQIAIRSRKLTRSDLEVALLDSAIHGVVEGGEKDSEITGIVIALSPGNRMTTCDENGRFNFYNLPAGEYTARIDESTLPEFYVVVPPGTAAAIASKEKTPDVHFTIEKHEPQLPVRKVLAARAEIAGDPAAAEPVSGILPIPLRARSAAPIAIRRSWASAAVASAKAIASKRKATRTPRATGSEEAPRPVRSVKRAPLRRATGQAAVLKLGVAHRAARTQAKLRLPAARRSPKSSR